MRTDEPQTRENSSSGPTARLLTYISILAFVGVFAFGVAVVMLGKASPASGTNGPSLPASHPVPSSTLPPASNASPSEVPVSVPERASTSDTTSQIDADQIYRFRLVEFDPIELPPGWRVIGEYRMNQGGVSSPADYTSGIQIRTDSGGLISISLVQDEIAMDQPDLTFSSAFEPTVLADGTAAWSIDDPEYGLAALGIVINSQTQMLFISEGGLGPSVLDTAYELIRPASDMTFCPADPKAPGCEPGTYIEGSPEL